MIATMLIALIAASARAQTFITDACQFYDANLKFEWSLPDSSFCKPLGGGEYLLVRGRAELRRVKIEGRKIVSEKWSRPIEAHHDLAIESSLKRVATLGSEYDIFGGRRTRFDTIAIFDLESGRELAVWSARADHAKIKGLLGKKLKEPVRKKDFGRDYWELTHLNSVEFLPGRKLAVSLGRHRHLAFFAWDEKSLTLESAVEVPGTGMTHSARYRDGSIYLYSNLLTPGRSGVVRYDLATRKFSNLEIEGVPPFFSVKRGNLALARTGSRALISNIDGSIHEVDLATAREIRRFKLSYRRDGYPDEDFYQLYYHD